MRIMLLLGCAVCACQRSSEPPKAAVQTEAVRQAPGEPASAEKLPRVEARPDGTIAFTATDRWGKPLDATYENLTFLKNALPALERSLTPAQLDALKADLTRLER